MDSNTTVEFCITLGSVTSRESSGLCLTWPLPVPDPWQEACCLKGAPGELLRLTLKQDEPHFLRPFATDCFSNFHLLWGGEMRLSKTVMLVIYNECTTQRISTRAHTKWFCPVKWRAIHTLSANLSQCLRVSEKKMLCKKERNSNNSSVFSSDRRQHCVPPSRVFKLNKILGVQDYLPQFPVTSV